jgi:hypothetical protein
VLGLLITATCFLLSSAVSYVSRAVSLSLLRDSRGYFPLGELSVKMSSLSRLPMVKLESLEVSEEHHRQDICIRTWTSQDWYRSHPGTQETTEG